MALKEGYKLGMAGRPLLLRQIVPTRSGTGRRDSSPSIPRDGVLIPTAEQAHSSREHQPGEDAEDVGDAGIGLETSDDPGLRELLAINRRLGSRVARPGDLLEIHVGEAEGDGLQRLHCRQGQMRTSTRCSRERVSVLVI